MKPSLPYMPLYFGDFLRSTAGWTLAERGAYLLLLATQWESGSLPLDMERLARIIGIDASTMASIWPVVSKKFVTVPAGLLNERLEAHRKQYLEYREKQSEGGKKGMRNRYGNRATGNVIDFQPTKDQPHG